MKSVSSLHDHQQQEPQQGNGLLSGTSASHFGLNSDAGNTFAATINFNLSAVSAAARFLLDDDTRALMPDVTSNLTPAILQVDKNRRADLIYSERFRCK